jgi:flagellar FliL protein
MAIPVRQANRQAGDHRRKPSRLHTTIVLSMLTLAAAAAGGIFGLQVHALVEKPRRQADQAAEFQTESFKPVFLDAAEIRNVPPVITNLAGPHRVWVRLESSIVLAGEPTAEDDLLAAKIGEDLLAFLRTISPTDIEGASGFQHLREDLVERVRVRSNGRARDLVIHSFIVE